MERFFKNTKKFIFSKQQDILSSAIIIALMIFVSRFFGFMRYRTLTAFFSTNELDIFFASFRIPDFVFEILITGALSSAFIPIFIKYEKDGEKLNFNISSLVNFIFICLLIFIIIAFLFAGFIVRLIAPGFTLEETKTVVYFSRILLVSQLPFLVLGNILSGMAQANKIFIITAIAPILYNLGIIFGTIILFPTLGILAPVVGVIIGALLFFFAQSPTFLVINFNYIPRSFNKKVLKEFIKLFVPRVLTVLTTQLDFTIDLALSSLLSRGSYTIFFFAQHLQLFPVSFFGMSFGQASLPYLSDLYRDGKIDEIKKIFVDSILQILFLTIPISFLLIFTRTPVVRIFFGGEKFHFFDTNLTALTLTYFALSLPFHAIIYFITRAFYAAYDTKRPFIAGVISVLVNTTLSLYFVYILKLPVWSLAISFSASIVVNVLILLIIFYKKIGSFDVLRTFKHTIKIYIASFLSALVAYPIMKLLDLLVLNTTRTINVLFLLLLTFCAFSLSYLFFSWFFNIEEIYLLGKMFIKIKEMKRKVLEVYTNSG